MSNFLKEAEGALEGRLNQGGMGQQGGMGSGMCQPGGTGGGYDNQQSGMGGGMGGGFDQSNQQGGMGGGFDQSNQQAGMGGDYGQQSGFDQQSGGMGSMGSQQGDMGQQSGSTGQQKSGGFMSSMESAGKDGMLNNEMNQFLTKEGVPQGADQTIDKYVDQEANKFM
ncbi:hypothetical protein BAUCODRAFT_35701 [Baudoinia panamericana UAMH 10762]|uniref:Uncharacterized protein n=1 Tax=Baudoinia panamericana (strain UAMH 10762) TaxID=717646 RepID=M2N6T2_BAUPA|nr:uncharacterized protein BAUCODRAFT_35701 [Baudoinia panamericana UAMH 10762]EMC94485.1 hypothetical protein BAUCODRAFT_35701 [Baudoinia panamericana UAMH 10762]